MQQARQLYQNEVDKLPTFFRLARIQRKVIKETLKEDDSYIEIAHLSFQSAIFLDTYLKKTKRNLRLALRKELKIVRVDFSPFGTSTTQRIYSNQIIQNFFEFSLHYSFAKRIELSFKKARRIFIDACKVSLNLSLQGESETQSFSDLLDFIYNRKSVFDNTNLPTYQEGRPKKPQEETERILTLAKRGMSNPQISRELEPTWKDDDRRRTAHIAHIGRTRRRYGLHTSKQQKTKG